MNKGIFLTVKDLMELTGCNNENSAGKMHRSIRDSISKGKRKLTIKEYCQFERINTEEVWGIIRRDQKYPF